MSVEDAIREKLAEAFAPALLQVKNESHLHSGHAASPESGESHFRVTIVSDCFEGASRLDRHRLVNEALATELAGPVHALAIKALSTAEHDAAEAG